MAHCNNTFYWDAAAKFHGFLHEHGPKSLASLSSYLTFQFQTLAEDGYKVHLKALYNIGEGQKIRQLKHLIYQKINPVMFKAQTKIEQKRKKKKNRGVFCADRMYLIIFKIAPTSVFHRLNDYFVTIPL